MKYPIVIFDCDGVILNSNHLKSEAMREAVADYPPDLVAQFVHYHKKNGGISRYEKFDYFLRNMANRYTKKEYNRLLNRLSTLVRTKLIDVPLTNGALDFIRLVHQQSDLYIVSGGDQDELRDVFKERDLAKYFHEIFGSPAKKVDLCMTIKNNLQFDKKALLIGDSQLDCIAADACGFDFVFISGYTEMENWQAFCAENSVSHYPDLQTLSENITS